MDSADKAPFPKPLETALKLVPASAGRALRKLIEAPEFASLLASSPLGPGPVSKAVASGIWAVVLLFAHSALGLHNSLCCGDPEERYRIAAQVASDFIIANLPRLELTCSIVSILPYLRTSAINGVKNAARNEQTRRKGVLAANHADATADCDMSYLHAGMKPERERDFSDVKALLRQIPLSDKPVAAAIAQIWLAEGPLPNEMIHQTLSQQHRFAHVSLQEIEVARALLIRRMRSLHHETDRASVRRPPQVQPPPPPVVQSLPKSSP